jgi:hypothetical protein
MNMPSKTTIAGLLSGMIAVLSVMVSFQTPAALLTPGVQHTLLILTTTALLVIGVARAVVGFLQNDAPPPASVAPITVTVPVPVTINPAPKDKP